MRGMLIVAASAVKAMRSDIDHWKWTCFGQAVG
jgi:hypothetical protein